MLWANETVWYFGKEMERNVLKLVYVIYEKVLEKVPYGPPIVPGVCLHEFYQYIFVRSFIANSSGEQDKANALFWLALWVYQVVS